MGDSVETLAADNWTGSGRAATTGENSVSPHQTATDSPKTAVIKTMTAVAGQVGVGFIVLDLP